jgi:hypothetical protein
MIPHGNTVIPKMQEKENAEVTFTEHGGKIKRKNLQGNADACTLLKLGVKVRFEMLCYMQVQVDIGEHHLYHSIRISRLMRHLSAAMENRQEDAFFTAY